MGLFKGGHGRQSRIVFYITIHSLYPWPAEYGLLAVEWERGSKRRGVTKAIAPTRMPGQNGLIYRFEETIRVPCTLSEGKTDSGFEKKVLLLTVIESQSKSKGKEKERLGSVVLNIADYAIGPTELRHSVQVACRKEITKEIGAATFEISIRRHEKAKYAHHGSDEGSSYAGSYADTSTVVSDSTVGVSRLDTQSMNSFASGDHGLTLHSGDYSDIVSSRHSGRKPPIQEQVYDEDGFLVDEQDFVDQPEETGGLNDMRFGGGTTSYRHDTEDYHRKEDYPGGVQRTSPLLGMRRPSSTATSTESEADSHARYSGAADGDVKPLGRIESGVEYSAERRGSRGSRWKSTLPKVNGVTRASKLGNRKESAPASFSARRASSSTDGAQSTPQPALASRRGALRTPLSETSNFTDVELDHDRLGTNTDNSPFMEVESHGAGQYGGQYNHHHNHHGEVSGDYHAGPEAQSSIPASLLAEANLESVLMELRTSAALEAGIYLARKRRVRLTGSHNSSAYAPARRIARTIITLGADEGVMFGLRAVKGMQYECDACIESSGDVCGVSFWWSNSLQLRWMLWAVCGGADAESPTSPRDAEGEALASFNTILQVIVPPLRDLEEYMFGRMADQLWHNVLLPAALAYKIDTKQYQALSQGETAVYRWLAGLSAVFNALSPLHQSSVAQTSPSHVSLLRQLMMAAMMRKMDATLLRALTWDVLPQRRSSNSGATRRKPNVSDIPSIGVDAKLLPFEVITLTFGEGVSLKMALTRWQEWGREAGLQEDVLKDRSGFFPKLRAAADLLMFPKDMLMDNGTRHEILPVLTIHEMCTMLNKFVPDDFAPDSVPRGLVQALRREAEMFPPPATSPKEWNYEPMSEQELLANHLIEPISLDMDDDSDGELTELEHMYNVTGEEAEVHRFSLLKDLWASAR